MGIFSPPGSYALRRLTLLASASGLAAIRVNRVDA